MRFGDDSKPINMEFRITPPSNLERFITHNEDWEISRTVDTDFTCFYLHNTHHIHYTEVVELARYNDFAGIVLREGCLCILMLNN